MFGLAMTFINVSGIVTILKYLDPGKKGERMPLFCKYHLVHDISL